MITVNPITKHILLSTNKIIDNSVLDSVEKGKLTKDQWREFAKQRYLAAKKFEDLLEAGIRKSKKDKELFEALSSNLRDERGLDIDGKSLKIGSHEKWRQDFYNALDIKGNSLTEAKPFLGTQIYDETLTKLMDEDVLTIAGAILLQEYAIPEEFKRIKTGRDLLFPEKFVLNIKDTTIERKKKLAARLYIDNHITHDLASHYPKLERALLKYKDDKLKIAQIIKGIDIITQAKIKFYYSLKQMI